MVRFTYQNKSLFCIFLFVLGYTVLYAQTSPDVLAMRKKWSIPASVDTMKNPFMFNTALLDTGRVLYQKACAVCHGDKGKGDGVAAAGLSVKPADHTSAKVQDQTDALLFCKLTNGSSPMPPFKTVFTEKERWGLVNYIRSLAKVKPALAKSKK